MTMPVLFISHGAPTLSLDQARGQALRKWAGTFRAPKAILVVSAHWDDPELALGTTNPNDKLMYDFFGFPAELYKVRYHAPGAPELARRVKELLPEAIGPRDERLWDHGAWTPLVHMYPNADIPLLEVSMPKRWDDVVSLGERLRPLRNEDVLLIGSGGAVHNLGRITFGREVATDSFAREFDAWVEKTLTKDPRELLRAKTDGPDFFTAHPSDEHFRPLLFAVGAGTGSPVTFPITGFEFGNLSCRSIQFG